MSRATKSRSKSTARTQSRPTDPPKPVVEMPLVTDTIDGREVSMRQLTYSQRRWMIGLTDDFEREGYLMSFVESVDGHADWMDRMSGGEVDRLADGLVDFLRR